MRITEIEEIADIYGRFLDVNPSEYENITKRAYVFDY